VFTYEQGYDDGYETGFADAVREFSASANQSRGHYEMSSEATVSAGRS
jgi:hypothetical protein